MGQDHPGEREVLPDEQAEYWRRRALHAELAAGILSKSATMFADMLRLRKEEIELAQIRQREREQAKIAAINEAAAARRSLKLAKAATIQAFAAEVGYEPIK